MYSNDKALAMLIVAKLLTFQVIYLDLVQSKNKRIGDDEDECNDTKEEDNEDLKKKNYIKSKQYFNYILNKFIIFKYCILFIF